MSGDYAEQTAREHQAIRDWVAENIGGQVVLIERQRRWRPVWRVEMAKDGAITPLLFKGVRPWVSIPYPLEHEMRMLRVLAANGIPVPRILGHCDFPHTIVMSWEKGGRDPGLVGEAIENKSEMTPDRWQASLKYMEVLAKIHKIDPGQFLTPDISMPDNARDAALNAYERYYQMYLDHSKMKDPFLEFCTLWLRRNVPRHNPMVSFVTGDCGQFLSDGPHITAVLDMEIGFLGDHFHDLACFRGRHPVENMGDVKTLFDHYEQALGVPLDLDAIAYHTVVFLAAAVFPTVIAMSELFPGGDWVEAALQTAFISRRAAEAMAEILDLPLDDIQLPAPSPTPVEDLAIDKLIYEIGRVPTSDSMAGWQRNTLTSIPAYLRNQLHFGGWARDQDLTDIAAILGYRPANIVEADQALLDFVQSAGPERDRELLRMFHRRLLRQCRILAGSDAPADHLVLMKVEPILHHKTKR